MTTGYNEDDDDDKQTTHPPPNSHYPTHYPSTHHHHHHQQPHHSPTPMHTDSDEAKHKHDADTHHPLSPLPRSLLPSHTPPQSQHHPAYIDYKEEKQPTPATPQLPPHPFRPLFLHEWLDVCDTEGSWLEAQVVGVSVDEAQVKVHYKGYKVKYDEWLDTSLLHPHASRIAPLHRYTRPKWPLPELPVVPLTADGELAAVLPVQVDCLDTTEKWLPAHLIQYDTQHHYALVSYDGWSADFNEWINLGSYRLAPPHTHSTTTSNKFVNVTNHTSTTSTTTTTDSHHLQHNLPLLSHSSHLALPIVAQPRYSASVDNEARFRAKLRTLGLGIVEQEQDGNCLFRSISHQLYDTGDYHRLVRETCMRYIDGEAAYFRAFVVGDFDAYVTRMCQPGEWGDHVEIQALSEVYDMPIEIYAYSTHPLRTYSRQDGSEGGGGGGGIGVVGGVRRPVMRLSYHFASHYNSVVEAGRYSGLLDGREVGEIEEQSIERQRHRQADRERHAREQRADEQQEEDALQRSLRVSRSQFGQASSVSEFDRAVVASLQEMDAEEERKVEEVKRESEREAVERDEMELVMQQSVADEMQHDIEQAEQAELNSALQSSLTTAIPHSSSTAAPAPADDEEEELRRAVQLSLQAAHPTSSSPTTTAATGPAAVSGVYPSAVVKLMDLGFSLESCVSAYSVFEGGGESEEVLVQNMMEYILAQRS